ncbi:two-component system response regulator [Vibrio sp. 10N.286.49.B3]|uniref:ATP-binding response regulator n=1 Tax=Vibrio sp. 10N.286.49.B3 TaxID=1880855 RepID=UPI000C842120|nr:response regulator [Vibrio sp. 10N.286.49.B3]PMH42203.1 two-component system response regulator [Vibrio sp. 10N.286.49.B3]
MTGMVKRSNISLPVLKISIAIALILFMTISYHLFRWYKADTISQLRTTTLIIEAQKLNQSIQFTIQQLEICLYSIEAKSMVSESCSDILTQVNSLQVQIIEFKGHASIEKQKFSLVGAVEYSKLSLALQKFTQVEHNKESLLSLYISLITNYLVINDNYRNLFEIRTNELVSEKNGYYLQLFSITAFTLFILIISNASALLKLKHFNKNERHVDDEMAKLSNQLKSMNSTNITNLLNDVNIDPQLRKIYSYLKALFSGIEEQKRTNDLYKQLYALIGYEIRGITTTINGGVQYLVQDADENGVLMARDITSAANTLSELAENYNRLISQGTENKSKDFSLLTLISELMVHLSSKVQRNDGEMECYIADDLPNRVEGHSTSLFWVLFLQLSNAIQLKSGKKLFISVKSSAAEDIERTRLTIALNFLTSFDVKLDKLDKLHWSKHQSQINSTDDMAKTILTDNNYFQTHWYQSGNQERFEIQLDINAKSFQQQANRLDDKHLLLCASNQLRIDIFNKLFGDLGLTITTINSPNELFKMVKEFKNFDGIMLTDTFDSDKLPSLAKTIKSQLKAAPDTKLLLSVANSQLAQESHTFVDKIFHTPYLPSEFIPSLITALESEASDDSLASCSFMIVEDDKVQQILLKRILSKQEYEAETVGDGADAVEKFKQNRIDIIFMDCIMPGMGGIEATQLIRQFEVDNEQFPCTIIGATALTSRSEHQACIEAGMDYVISKPYKSDEIIKVINKYVAVQKLN